MDQVQSEADVYPEKFGRATIVLFALGVVILSALIALWRITQDHRLTRQVARQQLILYAMTLGNQMEAMVRDSLGMAAVGARVVERSATPAERKQALERMLIGDEYRRGLFVASDQGFVIASRNGDSFGPECMPTMAELRSKGHGLWFGDVMVDEMGALVLPVARRVGKRQRVRPDDSEMWAGAFLRFRELDLAYSRLASLRANVALVTGEGFGLVQLPADHTALRNADITGSEVYREFRKMPEQILTLLTAPDVATGMPRLYAIYRIGSLPLVATAGQLVSDTYKEWRERTNAMTLSFLLWASVAMALAVRLQLLFNRRWRNLRQLLAAQSAAAAAKHAELVARRSMTREIMVAQERDRQRLASELHDSVGQHLTMLRNHAVQLKRGATSGESREHAEALIDLSSETIEEVRAVAHNLRPVHLEELGLSSALEVMLERIELSSGILVHSRIENVDDLLHGEPAVHAYRIVQEATSNVLRHAGARNLWVDVIHHEQEVELSIRDDGRGIEVTGSDSPGLGMTSIGERCEILGARLTVRDNQPQGTCIEIHIPRPAA